MPGHLNGLQLGFVRLLRIVMKLGEFQDVAVRFTVEAARDAGRFTIALVTHGADSPPLRPRVLGAWLAHGTRIYAAVTHVPAPHIRRSVST